MATPTQQGSPAWLSQTNVLWIPAIAALLYLITLAFQRGYQQAAGFSLPSLTHEAIANAATNVVLPTMASAAIAVLLGILRGRRLARRGVDSVVYRTNWPASAMVAFPIVAAALLLWLWYGYWSSTLLDCLIVGLGLIVYYACFPGRSDAATRRIVQVVALSVVLIQLAQILGRNSLLLPEPFEDCGWAGRPFVVIEHSGDIEVCAAFVDERARFYPSVRSYHLARGEPIFTCTAKRKIGAEKLACAERDSCLSYHEIKGL
jgi:hypothetical protein